MADEAQGTVAPVVPAVVATPTEASPPRVQAADLPPEALKARLDGAKEAARREMLAELGVTDTKDAKAALAELKTRRDAEKTESERLTARVAELETLTAKSQSLAGVVAARASAELAALPEKARAFVTASAGEDPAAQLATIDRMRANGLIDTASPAVAPVAALVTPAAPVAPVATSTAPRPNAPSEAGTVAQADLRATYERLRGENPFAAAQLADRYAGDLFLETK